MATPFEMSGEYTAKAFKEEFVDVEVWVDGRTRVIMEAKALEVAGESWRKPATSSKPRAIRASTPSLLGPLS